MLPGQIQGDAKFRAFQEKLATIVVTASSRGLRVSGSYASDCCCPLGAHPDSTDRYPSSVAAAREGWSGVPREHLSLFVRGFSSDALVVASPYFELGTAYREQFP
jgi:hypothetical protein